MLDPQAGDAERNALADEAKNKLASDGTLNHESSWGMRKMAYEIDNRGEADYRYFRFSGEKPLLDQLNHALRITDGVLRFRIFKVDPESPIIVPPDTEVIMRRDEEDDRGRGRGGRGRDDRGPRRDRDNDSSDDSRSSDAAPVAAAAESPAAEDDVTPAPAAETAPEAAPAPAAEPETADSPAAEPDPAPAAAPEGDDEAPA